MRRYKRVAFALTGNESASEADGAGELYDLIDDMPIPTLREMGLTRDMFPDVIEQAMQTGAMGAMTEDDLALLLKASLFS